ncbi:DUF397 domain-containing protein [Embleya sp. NBC_00896]|uniref:DUF397 domain-containing protein n=1 Tax=Embleya sp. NBC_00896 TaxID=2975961 RepID=UPI003867FDB6|nr:DUF397 domain-containing protein [Embleya sp. NBC_00896]
MSTAPHSPRWFKSSHSGNQEGNCVETAFLMTAVGVRDSKDTSLGQIAVDPASWSAMLGAIKA